MEGPQADRRRDLPSRRTRTWLARRWRISTPASKAFLRPIGVRDKMVQRLIRPLDATRLEAGAIGSLLLRSPGRISPIQ